MAHIPTYSYDKEADVLYITPSLTEVVSITSVEKPPIPWQFDTGRSRLGQRGWPSTRPDARELP